ncbi:hypothetical protein BZA77DRAFT_324918 [Pyronema omphalodes]|nr:hypothetical protein BZA77DRAFT_324918 [Pyronema omphalodes]
MVCGRERGGGSGWFLFCDLSLCRSGYCCVCALRFFFFSVCFFCYLLRVSVCICCCFCICFLFCLYLLFVLFYLEEFIYFCLSFFIFSFFFSFFFIFLHCMTFTT